MGAFQYCMDMRAQAAKDPASVKGTEDVTLCPPVNSTAPTPSMCICATKVKAGQGVCPCIRVDPDDYQMDFIKIKVSSPATHCTGCRALREYACAGVSRPLHT